MIAFRVGPNNSGSVLSLKIFNFIPLLPDWVIITDFRDEAMDISLGPPFSSL